MGAVFAWRTYPTQAGADDGAYLTAPGLVGVRLAFTTRRGGVSDGTFARLNLSYVSGDEPGRVLENRRRALDAIGLAHQAWTGARQVHGTNVVRVSAAQRGAGARSPEDTIPDTDALWTDQRDLALVVLTADCVPLVLADPARRRIAVVHVGWRGLIGGIIEKAVGEIGTSPGLVALAGPSIGPCCYEVGNDVARPALERFGNRVMRGGCLDLWAGASAALRASGVHEAWFAALCTKCEPGRFYSHRRGDAARQGAVACLA